MALPLPEPFLQDALHKTTRDGASDPLWDAARRADGSFERSTPRTESDAYDEDPPQVSLTRLICPPAAAAPSDVDPAVLWTEIVAGRVKPYYERLGETRYYAILSVVSASSGVYSRLTDAEAMVLLRVFSGDGQKVISTDLAIAHSTASKRCAQGLEKLDLTARTTPLPVVVAAQRAAGVLTNANMRQTYFEYDGAEYLVASMARPRIQGRSTLTSSEQAIAQMLVEGSSRWQIAEARATTVQTVSCQLRAIFAKFQSTGRYSVTRRAAELGWFDDV